MNSANDKLSTEAKLDFKDLQKRIGITKSNVVTSFKQVAKANRSTLESIETLYSEYKSSLEENYTYNKRVLTETANSNYESKENWFNKIENFSDTLNSLEASVYSINNLPQTQYQDLLASFKDLTNPIQFTELCLKNIRTNTVLRPFDLNKSEKTKRKHSKWFFINPTDSSERPFLESVERQLENGFIRDSCKYKLKLESGDVIGYADFNAMELETINPKQILKLLRKAL